MAKFHRPVLNTEVDKGLIKGTAQESNCFSLLSPSRQVQALGNIFLCMPRHPPDCYGEMGSDEPVLN